MWSIAVQAKLLLCIASLLLLTTLLACIPSAAQIPLAFGKGNALYTVSELYFCGVWLVRVGSHG